MDDIFASEDEEARGRLLKIMQEFLVSEAEKHAAKEKGEPVQTISKERQSLKKAQFRRKRSFQQTMLIWTSWLEIPTVSLTLGEMVLASHGLFSDPTIDSVSSAVVQRYPDYILVAALSQTPQVQGSAVDILSFTIKQGLAHPLQVLSSSLSTILPGLSDRLVLVLPRNSRTRNQYQSNTERSC